MIYVCYLKLETFLESLACCAYWSLTHGVTCYTACLDCVPILGCNRSHWEHLGSSSREALLKPRGFTQAVRFIFQRWSTSCVHNSGELRLEISQSTDSCLHILSMSFDFIKTFVNMLSEVLWVLLTICSQEIIMVSEIWYYMVRKIFPFSLIHFCQYAFIDSWIFFTELLQLQLLFLLMLKFSKV